METGTNPFRRGSSARQPAQNSTLSPLNLSLLTPLTAVNRTNPAPRELNDANDRILIAVFGMTGTGKTTLIQKLSGKELKIGHALQSCTQEIQEVECRVGSHNLTLVDTPGFDDTKRSDTEVLSLIAAWLLQSYKTGALLSGIIYLHRISDRRMTGSVIKNLRMFRKLCGPDHLQNVRLVTTMWDDVQIMDGEQRERDLISPPDGFWAPMIAYGCKFSRHQNTQESAEKLVLELVGNKPAAIHLQEEMRAGKALIETDAGSLVNEEISKMRKQYEDDLAAYKEEMKIAIETKNELAQIQLRNSHAQTVAQLRKNGAEQASLMSMRAEDLEARLRDVVTENARQKQTMESQVAEQSTQLRQLQGELSNLRLRREGRQTSSSVPSFSPPLVPTYTPNPIPRQHRITSSGRPYVSLCYECTAPTVSMYCASPTCQYHAPCTIFFPACAILSRIPMQCPCCKELSAI